MVLDEAKYREFVENIRKPFLPNYEVKEGQEVKRADTFNTVIDGLTGIEYSLEEMVKISKKRRAEQQQAQQQEQEKSATTKEQEDPTSPLVYDKKLLPLNERDEKGLLN